MSSLVNSHEARANLGKRPRGTRVLGSGRSTAGGWRRDVGLVTVAVAVVFESGQQAPDTWMSHGCFSVELCDGDDAIIRRGAEPRMRSVRGDPQYPWTMSHYFCC